MVEYISFNENLYAIILRSAYKAEGIKFFTPEDFSQQLGYMMRPAGYSIDPHIHNKVSREVFFTQEVLFIRTGRVRVDFYDDHATYHESRILHEGDFILLANGGHGFFMLEASEIIEIKQGPFVGLHDKRRFDPVSLDCVRLSDEKGISG